MTSSAVSERRRFSGLTTSSVNSAIARSPWLELQMDRPGLHRFQFDFVVVIDTRHFTRHATNPFQPKKVLAQLSHSMSRQHRYHYRQPGVGVSLRWLRLFRKGANDPKTLAIVGNEVEVIGGTDAFVDLPGQLGLLHYLHPAVAFLQLDQSDAVDASRRCLRLARFWVSGKNRHYPKKGNQRSAAHLEDPPASLGCHSLCVFHRLVDTAHHIKRGLWKLVVLTLCDLLESPNRIRKLDVTSLLASEDLGHEERLREKALNLPCPGDGELVLLGKLIHSQDRNNVL